MKVRVLAFATAADALGSRELELDVEEGTTVGKLLARLEVEAPGLGPLRDRLAVAVNGELAPPETTLTDSAEVALLPPVSGGDTTPVRLVSRPIDASEVSIPDPTCGAEVLFLGRVRNHSRGRGVTKITYQGYRAMAEARLLAICRDLSREGTQLRIVHRLGDVPVGELSVAIAARAPHRSEAFAACAQALERLKRETPIWKLEHYDDGSLAWREEEPLAAGTGRPASSA
ncbi:MAG: molybdenum cofactor biosynthesis protein MoaE [bacterium]|nr:molybdenum cofactor biosynthesis protein MoaE [bacterium]